MLFGTNRAIYLLLTLADDKQHPQFAIQDKAKIQDTLNFSLDRNDASNLIAVLNSKISQLLLILNFLFQEYTFVNISFQEKGHLLSKVSFPANQ